MSHRSPHLIQENTQTNKLSIQPIRNKIHRMNTLASTCHGAESHHSLAGERPLDPG